MKNSPERQAAKDQSWMWAIIAPFAVCFLLGGMLGWLEIEKDSGRILRDTGRQVTGQDYYQSALSLACYFGIAGAAMGGIGLGFGCALIAKKTKHDSVGSIQVED